MYRIFAPLCAFLALSQFCGTQATQCLDENNNPVDWIYLYKLPKQVSPNGNGLDFLFLHDKSNGWQLSHRTIDDVRSIPGSLISQLTAHHLVIMYNDEPPGQKSDETRGHTKGVVAANLNGGFWLVHSVPKFPAAEYTSYSYPPTGHLYGQSFLCISMTSKDLDGVADMLTFNEPHVYLGQVPESLQSLYPKLHRVAAERTWITEPPFFKSVSVANFTMFSKSHKFNKELYVDWVAPVLQSDLMVESWLHGPGVISTECEKQFKVYNVDHLTLPTIKPFSSMEDHSKWAVGKQDNWLCVGDINRAEHQKRRGGGTVCRFGQYTADAYRSLIDSLYPCPKNGSLN